jgi:hypothetical protein
MPPATGHERAVPDRLPCGGTHGAGPVGSQLRGLGPALSLNPVYLGVLLMESRHEAHTTALFSSSSRPLWLRLSSLFLHPLCLSAETVPSLPSVINLQLVQES